MSGKIEGEEFCYGVTEASRARVVLQKEMENICGPGYRVRRGSHPPLIKLKNIYIDPVQYGRILSYSCCVMSLVLKPGWSLRLLGMRASRRFFGRL